MKNLAVAEEIPAEIDDRFSPYQPFGRCVDVFYDKSDAVLLCGPAGTGKSRAALEKLHLLMSKYPNARGLMVRKTRTSLTQSAMVTFEKQVLPRNDSVIWRTGEQEYRYANGSVVVVGGMDKAIKIMSTDYDFIYVQEATEISEDDYESLTTRCRNPVMPYNQILMDCNPSAPWHWLKIKADKGEIKLYNSVHEDNPMLYDQRSKKWTERGKAYLAKLDKLSGVRFDRLRKGIWAAAEGLIYTEWNPDVHLIDRFPIPTSWQRFWTIDFGFINPFVWQAWALDNDGILYRFAEIYMTKLLVEDACALIKAWMVEKQEMMPSAVICDHDAEDRATFERHMNITTVAADKAVSAGIEAVKSRLKIADNNKPRIKFLRDSTLEIDVNLQDAMKPICTEQEFEGYVWEDSTRKEQPKKVDDHGLDATRYISVHVAKQVDGWARGMR